MSIVGIPTLIEVLPEFGNFVFANSSEINAKNSEKRLRYFVKFVNDSDFLITQLTASYVDQYVVFMKVNKLRPKTQHNRVSALKSFERFLMERYPQFIKKSFASHVKIKLPKPKPGDKLPNKNHVEKVMNLIPKLLKGTARDIRDATIFLMILETGIRRSECVFQEIEGLHLDQEPMDTQLGTIYKAVLTHAKSANTNPDAWVIDYNDKLKQVIEKWLSVRPHPLRDPGRVFVGVVGRPLGKPMTPDGINFVFKRLCKLAELHEREITPHKLRHYFGQRVLDLTGNLELTRQRLRHADIKLTSTTYAHQDERRRQSTVGITTFLNTLKFQFDEE
ncbi:MAG: tyrosine-type recombinase/integrase [Chloroflexota bacterium]